MERLSRRDPPVHALWLHAERDRPLRRRRRPCAPSAAAAPCMRALSRLSSIPPSPSSLPHPTAQAPGRRLRVPGVPEAACWTHLAGQGARAAPLMPCPPPAAARQTMRPRRVLLPPHPTNAGSYRCCCHGSSDHSSLHLRRGRILIRCQSVGLASARCTACNQRRPTGMLCFFN